MIDEGGHSLYLFFGTTSDIAVQKFKDGLWEVDDIAGQRFRDPRDPNQMSFDILQPDFTPLANSIIELLQVREHNMAELCQHALLVTIYKDTHVKPVVDSLVDQRKVHLARTGRSYEERVLRLAPASLFWIGHPPGSVEASPMRRCHARDEKEVRSGVPRGRGQDRPGDRQADR